MSSSLKSECLRKPDGECDADYGDASPILLIFLYVVDEIHTHINKNDYHKKSINKGERNNKF